MSVPTTEALSGRVGRILAACGATIVDGEQSARTPITGGSLGPAGSAGDVSDAVDRAVTAFATWRETPGPARGATVRRLGELLRDHKDELGELVSIERVLGPKNACVKWLSARVL
jgi:aldehyde dehydrogenase (NAD+)